VETNTPTKRDVLEEIVQDMHDLYPRLEVTGLPIIGRVLRLARYLENRREEQLGQYGLTVPDFDVLATMRRQAGDRTINIRELQRSMMLSSGGTTKRLDRLEKAGHIERLPDPADRRGVLIRLTSDGLALIDDILPAVTHAENDVVSNAVDSDEERASVADVLRRLLLAQEDLESKAPDD
jgi:DNA-binding MarR family transcriptional regulator